MLINWVDLLLGVVLVEAITNIVTKSGIFLRVREFFFCREDSFFVFRFLSDMLQCPYCFSVWAGWFISIGFGIKFDFSFILSSNSFVLSVVSYFFSGLVLHRLSNILHTIIDCINYSVVKPSEERTALMSSAVSNEEEKRIVVEGFKSKN